MHNAFSYQLLIDLLALQQQHTYPTFLKDIVKSRNIHNFKRLGDFWDSELQNSALQDRESMEYFLFILQSTLRFYFFRLSPQQFYQTVDLAKHRMTAIRHVEKAEIDLASWEKYIDLMTIAFNRVIRHVSIEEYEAYIDQLDWPNIQKQFIPDISSIIGYTYLCEDMSDQKSKSRLWLSKAVRETTFEKSVANHLYLANYYYQVADKGSHAQIESVVKVLTEGQTTFQHKEIKTIIQYAIEDLETMLFNYQLKESNTGISATDMHGFALRESLTASQDQTNGAIPEFVKAYRKLLQAEACSIMASCVDGEPDQQFFTENMSVSIQSAIALAEEVQDTISAMHYRNTMAEIFIQHQQPITEKELKEIIQFYRKKNLYIPYIQASKSYTFLLVEGKQPQKALDVILDLFKQGNKNIEEGGFYLFTAAFRLANDLFLTEIRKPGVSWIVAVLDVFFEEIRQIIDQIDEYIPIARPHQLEAFRSEYLRFEPVSYFNIKVYFQYQLYTLKMILLGTQLQNDKMGQVMSEKLVEKFENANNPLSMLKADWDEFKDVPNDVRNKTLNWCINISKGDLPLAAEHLDFSYRNLRSYITFKEVNRLGFFLELQETDNKQLELGIRYLFHDLYKKGTIFEVVFDMPQFLVKYSKSGFYSQDLEQELNIKGTTAKKYIKIMMEIGLIRQDKTTGRKHYYRLVRENVMKRLGREQNTLIE